MSKAEILAAALRRRPPDEDEQPAPLRRLAASAPPPTGHREHGRIKVIVPSRAFGFILADRPSQPDLFLPGRSIEALGLEVGERITFEASQNPNKPGKWYAANVERAAP